MHINLNQAWFILKSNNLTISPETRLLNAPSVLIQLCMRYLHCKQPRSRYWRRALSARLLFQRSWDCPLSVVSVIFLSYLSIIKLTYPLQISWSPILSAWALPRGWTNEMRAWKCFPIFYRILQAISYGRGVVSLNFSAYGFLALSSLSLDVRWIGKRRQRPAELLIKCFVLIIATRIMLQIYQRQLTKFLIPR